jgi:uncharacterized glyoxalase superfamily protein PhnB
MTDYAGQSYPTICPYLYYEDGVAAMDWLAKAFGFRERTRTVNADGSLRHAEMELGNGVIMIGTPSDHKNPAHLGQVTVGIYVHVDDVDHHYQQAKASGADIDSPPSDQAYGVRSYGAHDPEGHQFWFSQALDT